MSMLLLFIHIKTIFGNQHENHAIKHVKLNRLSYNAFTEYEVILCLTTNENHRNNNIFNNNKLLK